MALLHTRFGLTGQHTTPLIWGNLPIVPPISPRRFLRHRYLTYVGLHANVLLRATLFNNVTLLRVATRRATATSNRVATSVLNNMSPLRRVLAGRPRLNFIRVLTAIINLHNIGTY